MTGERNYHIFYDLLSGVTSSAMCLESDPMAYQYLAQSVEKGGRAEGGEKGMFDHVCHSMEVHFISVKRSCLSPLFLQGNRDRRRATRRALEGPPYPCNCRFSPNCPRQVLSGILHLGNTHFLEVDTVEGLKAEIEVKGNESRGGLGSPR